MNKKLYLIAGTLVAILVMGGILYFFSSEKPVINTVKSSDGKMQLTFQDSSLPEGLSPKDISITPINTEEIERIEGAWRLQPEGIKFNEPLVATIELEGDLNRAPIVTMQSEDDIEGVKDTEISIAQNQTTITAPIEHFSVLVVEEGLEVEFSPDSITRNIGESFAVGIDVRAPRSFSGGGRSWKNDEGIEFSEGFTVEISHLSITEEWVAQEGNILDPPDSEVKNETFEPPQRETIGGGLAPMTTKYDPLAYTSQSEFTCVNSGQDTLELLGFFVIQGTKITYSHGAGLSQYDDGNPYDTSMRLTKQIPVECVAEEDEQEATIGEDEEERTSDVVMLDIDGVYYPKHQFSIASPDRCEEDHYHSQKEAYGLRHENGEVQTEVVSSRDPAPGQCGFGTVENTPTVNVNITYEQSVELLKYLE
ncbi:MAG: hypothetical protein R3346_03325 [Candidatus Spechtbacterales bacterium]|nr:hypothetical protein [Candidatus Spechtbacterales bacterium]